MSKQKQESTLITGARGFIGRAVARLLHRSGHPLILLDEIADGTVDRTALSDFACDISNRRELRAVFETKHITAVIHLAAILPTTASKNPARATEVNVSGSLNLLELSREFGIRRLVLGSSLSIYGSCAADQVVSETWRAAPEDLYGAAKLYVEQLGETYAKLYGTEFVSLRIGRVIGPGAQSATSPWRSQIFDLLCTRRPVEINVPYRATERILLVHVNDVARALVTILQAPRPAHSIYNAPCESVVVADLKEEIESLNRNINVKLGQIDAIGNPRFVDSSRFQKEFGFESLAVSEHLRRFAATTGDNETAPLS